MASANRRTKFSRIEKRLFQLIASKASVAVNLYHQIHECENVQDMLTSHARLIGTGQIAMGFAHDSRNSLMSINALQSSLIREIPEFRRKHEAIAELINTLTAETELLRIYFDRLTNYARLVETKYEFHDLRKIIEFVNDIFLPRLRKKRISLDISKVEPDLLMECDRDQIEQAFMNFLNNSMFAIESAVLEKLKTLRQIQISARKTTEDKIEIFISDDGIGIPEHHFLLIFEPFFTTKGKRGTGFGLTICKQIIEKNHAGKIDFSSEFGKKTTFHISLPMTQIHSDRRKTV